MLLMASFMLMTAQEARLSKNLQAASHEALGASTASGVSLEFASAA